MRKVEAMDKSEFVYQVARLIRQRAKWNWANEFPEPARQMDSLCWTVLDMAGLTDNEKVNTLALIDGEIALLHPTQPLEDEKGVER